MKVVQNICGVFTRISPDFHAPLVFRNTLRANLLNNRTIMSEAAAATLVPSLRAALLQLEVSENKLENIRQAGEAIREAAKNDAQLIVLPEIWNGPYAATSFPEYCEEIPCPGDTPCADRHPTIWAVAEEAKKCKVPIVAGSISERGSQGEVFNTSVVLDHNGVCLARHRKVHLFDIDIPGKITFRESDTLTAGSDVTTVDIPCAGRGVRVGIGICYDVRFPELSLAMRSKGCQLLVFPGAFNTTTGPLHWSLLLRARAVDTQCFVLACSPSRNPEGYPAYGHSMAVDPSGNVLVEAGEKPETLFVDLPLSSVSTIRSQIPVSFQRRHDIYPAL